MADMTEEEKQRLIEQRKARQFKKFTYRGKTVDELMSMSNEEVLDLVKARTRRRMQRGLKRRSQVFMRKLRKAKAGKYSLLSERRGRLRRSKGGRAAAQCPCARGARAASSEGGSAGGRGAAGPCSALAADSAPQSRQPGAPASLPDSGAVRLRPGGPRPDLCRILPR